MDPNYSTLSLLELKQVAKTRRIKQYYIMKRAALIELLSLPELPAAYRIQKLTIHQLRDMAKQQGIRGFWGLNRHALVQLLYPDEEGGDVHKTAANKNEKNQSNADKHDDPQKHDAE
jgi:hypothetical protein